MTTTPATYTDPQSGIALTYQQLLNDIVYLKEQIDSLKSGQPNVAQFLPSFAPTPDGKGLVVSVNSIPLTTITLPVYSYWAGDYVAGATYTSGALVRSSGSVYLALATFTATTLAADLTANHVTIFLAGVSLPITSPNVTDSGSGATQTLDVVLAGIRTQLTKHTTNIAAINAQLGTDSVAHFPITLS